MRTHFIQHVHFEHPGLLLEWATGNDDTITFTKVFENDEYPLPADYDRLIIMGGPMGANDESIHPWLRNEKDCISAALSTGKQVIGICLGAQLLASVLGADVYPNNKKEIGWWPVKVIRNPDDLLTADWPDSWTPFHWHGDTFDLPQGAELIFTTEACRNQGFQYRKQAIGLQFHMEATPELVNSMIENGSNELVNDEFVQSKEIIQQEEHFEENKALLYSLLNNFQL
ncbi:MAG: amidotransferase [Chitinophagaceae bacterium]|nr:MAG: amidotransferase [Chitinophagaceae bacterium]